MNTLFRLVSLFLAVLSARAQTIVQNTTYNSGQTLVVTGPITVQAGPNVMVSSGANITYQATASITLMPGFHAQTGSVFQAAIVVPPAPVVTSPTTATGSTGWPFSYTIVATGLPTSFGASNLPSWLSIDASTGVISGTPTAPGTFTVQVRATNASGTGQLVALTITVGLGKPYITSPLSEMGGLGSPFSYTIVATNSPTSYSASGLPSGLSLNSATGAITGTPPTKVGVGAYEVLISATNSVGTGTATLSLAITNPYPVITSPSVAVGFVGQPFTYTITATGTPISFGAKRLPSGLSLNASTGVISGTPTAPGTSVVILSATISYTAPVTGLTTLSTTLATLTLTVSPQTPVIQGVIQGVITATGTAGVPFNYAVLATNDPSSYSASGLPSGLSIGSTTGVISGTTAATGTFRVQIGATNAAGTASATLVLNITVPAPVISSALTASGTVNSIFSYTITASNSPTSYSASGLPAGLSISVATGVISGTPTTAGVSEVTIGAANAGGTAYETLVITIAAAGGGSLPLVVERPTQ